LTQGDTITVKTDLKHNPEFKFDIIEIKPVSPYKTVSIINCDLNLDFEAPLDYEEVPPEQPTLNKRSSNVLIDEQAQDNKQFSEFTGKYTRLDGKALKEDPSKKKEEFDPRKNKLKNGIRDNLFTEAFTGKALKMK
jgi:ubiquitin fusion degradation protein 1